MPGSYTREFVVKMVLDRGIDMPAMGKTMDDQAIADVAAWLADE